METDQDLTLREVALRASQQVGGLQGRALDREAKRRGLTLSYTTVDKIIAGTYNSRPTAKTLDALAELARLPLAEVYAAAGLPMSSKSLAEQLPPEADLLDEAQRRVVIDIVRVFSKQNRELHMVHRLNGEVIRSEQRSAANARAGERPAAEHERYRDSDFVIRDAGGQVVAVVEVKVDNPEHEQMVARLVAEAEDRLIQGASVVWTESRPIRKTRGRALAPQSQPTGAGERRPGVPMESGPS